MKKMTEKVFLDIYLLDAHSFYATIDMLNNSLEEITFRLTDKTLGVETIIDTDDYSIIFKWDISGAKLLKYELRDYDPEYTISLGLNLEKLKSALQSIKATHSCRLYMTESDDENLNITIYQNNKLVSEEAVDIISAERIKIKKRPTYDKSNQKKMEVSNFVSSIKAGTTKSKSCIIVNFNEGIKLLSVGKEEDETKKMKKLKGNSFMMVKGLAKNLLKICGATPKGSVIRFNENKRTYRMKFQSGCYGKITMDIGVKSF